MTDAFRDYTSLGLIIPVSIEEKGRILAYITCDTSADKNWKRYYNPGRLGYATIEIMETDERYIWFRSSHTGVYKPSYITELLKNSVRDDLTNILALQKVLEDTIALDETGITMSWDMALKIIPALTDAFYKVREIPFLKEFKRLNLKEVLNHCIEMTEDLRKVQNVETLEEKLRDEGFQFKMLEAVSKWDDRHEEWEMIIGS